MRRYPAIIFMIALFSGCSPRPAANVRKGSDSLSIFAAASLTDAFTAIGVSFMKDHPEISLHMNFSSSNSLRLQIEQGADADVFASANTDEIDALLNDGLVSSGSEHIFLTNSLVVVLPSDNPGNIGSLYDLKNPGVKLVLAAEEVPAGKYARQTLLKLDTRYGPDYSGEVINNLVSNEENVRLVLTKVQLGEADAGIVYASDAKSAPDLIRIDIPEEFNVVAKYPIAIMENAPHADTASIFIAFVLSTKGQKTLEEWGFAPVGSTSP
jgi:molybdate transport system substrate-binding protein